MTTVTVEIDKEKDLPALEAVLSKMGLKFHVEDEEDWGDLPDEAIEGIKAGLADIEAGRVHTHEYVMSEMKKTIGELRKKNA
jgi:predicted transcriptional regulator